MNITDYIYIASAVLIVTIVVAVIRAEVQERRYHRHFMASLRRSQMNAKRMGSDD